jgi:GT2 family glycosyltransferase
MKCAPIVLFVYNRPTHTLKTLQALSNNNLAKDSILYVFADGPKESAATVELEAIRTTRDVATQQRWCKDVIVIESDFNKGLAESIVSGVTEVLRIHGRAIVLEDDTVPSVGFLAYMNSALNLYQNDKEVMHVSAYLPHTTGSHHLPPTFLLRYMNCWGWATWEQAWNKLILDSNKLFENLIKRPDLNEFELGGRLKILSHLEKNVTGEMNTWAIKWHTSIFLNNGLCLFPSQSLITQIGFDGSGTHCDKSNAELFEVEISKEVEVKRVRIAESRIGKDYIYRFFKYGHDSSILRRAKILKNKLINPLMRKIKNY